MTTNIQKHLNEEIRQRERVIRIFPNDESACRLIGALLAEMNEQWQARKYLDMDEFNEWMMDKEKDKTNVVELNKLTNYQTKLIGRINGHLQQILDLTFLIYVENMESARLHFTNEGSTTKIRKFIDIISIKTENIRALTQGEIANNISVFDSFRVMMPNCTL